MATNKGRELALQIGPVIGTTSAITETCSQICRLAKTHHTLAERACNGYKTPGGDWDEQATEKAEQREQRIEERIESNVRALPEWEEDGTRGAFGVAFSGDPRGCTVKLTGPRSVYDSWGGDGVCVPV